MNKDQAYNFFLDALSKKRTALNDKLDRVAVTDPQYAALSAEHAKVQQLLAALDDIANAVK